MYKLKQCTMNHIEKNTGLENISNLDINLACICASKDIEVIDENNFVLTDRRLILDYHILTGGCKGIFKNLLRGKATLNKNQLEEYQRKDFVRVHGEFNYSFSFNNYHTCCSDLEH